MSAKKILYLSLFISSLNSMQKQQSSSWCGLDIAAYKVGRVFGRNDYLYLAHANSVWFLQKKIALHENSEDLDKYYARYQTILRTKNGSKSLCIYYTPLHEAVRAGSLECVKILCEAGADPYKIIQTEVEKAGIAEESYYQSIVTHEYNVPFDRLSLEMSRARIQDYVRCSAIDLAYALKDKETSSSLRQARQDICNYLHKANVE